MLDNDSSRFSPVLVRREKGNKAARFMTVVESPSAGFDTCSCRMISLGVLTLAAITLLASVLGRTGESDKSLSLSQGDFAYGPSASFSTLASSGVDLATLPPEMERRALQGGTGNFPQGRAKYDDLLANGPLGTPTTSLSKANLDLQTLSPQAQLKYLSGRGHPESGDDKYDRMISNGLGTPQQQHKAKGKDSDQVKLGSNIGLDGSIHLLRSAREIIAERLARARGIVPEVRSVRASSAPSQAAADRGSRRPTAEQRQQGGQSSAEARLAAEEARLRSSMANLERRAADTEMSDDQGLLGRPRRADRRR